MKTQPEIDVNHRNRLHEASEVNPLAFGRTKCSFIGEKCHIDQARTAILDDFVSHRSGLA